jgi:DNA-binding NtrC family response regulator
MLEFMQRRPWPGNIRELENFVERTVTVADSGKRVIEKDGLPVGYRDELKQMVSVGSESSVRLSLQEDLAEHERNLIQRTLEETHWNQSKAARILRISERTMRYKIENLGIKRP